MLALSELGYGQTLMKIFRYPKMQRYNFSIALRIWHPNIDPAVITGILGLPSSNSASSGQPRRTPKGQPLGGRYAER